MCGCGGGGGGVPTPHTDHVTLLSLPTFTLKIRQSGTLECWNIKLNFDMIYLCLSLILSEFK